MTKIYSSKHYYFSFNVMAGGRRRNVTFTGGTYYNGKQVNGTFVVSDATLAEAIENTSYFRTGQVFLVNGSGVPEEAAKKDKAENAKREAAAKKKAKAEEPEKNSGDVAGGAKKYDCKTVQAASRVLNEEYGVPFGEANTREKVLRKAEELNITFEGI